MRLNLLSDAHWESRIVGVLNDLSSTGYRDLFASRNYGHGLSGITIVFMCREPSLNFKQRIRLAKKEKKLYLDVMLDLVQMREANPESRRRIVAERLASEVATVLHKTAISNFDAPHFVADLKDWLKSIGWI